MSNTSKQANANNSRWAPPNVVKKQQQEGSLGFYNKRNCQNNFTDNPYATPPPSTKYHHCDSNTHTTTTYHEPYTTPNRNNNNETHNTQQKHYHNNKVIMITTKIIKIIKIIITKTYQKRIFWNNTHDSTISIYKS